MKKIVWLAAAMIACLLSIEAGDCPAKPPHRAGIAYATYYNDRYNYSLDYPVGVLYPQREADNGDGRVLLSRDKRTEARVYAWGNALFHTLRYEFDQDAGRVDDRYPTRTITYQVLKKDWFVLSGYEDGTIFYEKVLYRDGFFELFIIRYPKEQRKYWDPIAARMGRSFKG